MYNAPNYTGYRQPVQPIYNYAQPQQQIYQQPQMVMPQPQQVVAQPQMQQPIEQVQPIAQPLPIQNIRFLNADQIRGYVMNPNTKEMLIDKENKIVHIKTVNSFGDLSCEKYKYEQISDEDIKTLENKPAEPKIDTSNFVTKDMLDGFAKSSDLSNISEQIEALQKQIKINEILNGGKKDTQIKGE